MFSLRLNGEYLDIRIESKLSTQAFRGYTDFMKSMPGAYYVEHEYKWMLPKRCIDAYAARYEDMTAWHTTIEAIKGIEEVLLPEFPLITDYEDFKLKPYEFQQQGISFLAHVGSGIIGDEMGLGKTIQSMGAAHMLWKQGKVKKILVICPSSLKYQWSSEIEKFLGHTNIVIDGKNPKQKKDAFLRFVNGDYLFGIANYELIRSMSNIMKDYHYDVIIADEAHRLKNRESITYKAVKQLSSNYRIASTGTPLQNNIEELYALFEWVQPGLLGKITEFRKKHIVYASKFGRRYVPIGSKRLGDLRRQISPFMLRRMKKDVATDLPPMIFHRRDVDMDKDQAKLYSQIQEDFMKLMDELQSQEVNGRFDEEGKWVEDKRDKEQQILGYLYMMIAASDHPDLIKMGNSYMAMQYRSRIPDGAKSPKLLELIDICKEQLEAGSDKIVIFTQFARMQNIIEQELSKYGKVAILNGSMSSAQRQEQIETFRDDPEYKFFCLTDAGNYGINLQFSNTLINYDCPWNPATFEQRAGRVHRIGSKHSIVNIISLVTMDTIDEKIQATLEEKRKLGEAVIERNASERSMMNNLISSMRKKQVA